ncbi:hypothetical protein ACOSQ3_021457 [Xanthoceras sorbifolium]
MSSPQQPLASGSASMESDASSSQKRRSQVQALSSSLNFKLPLKLDHRNYSYWKMQILPVIRAFDLEDFVLNCKKCPDKYVSSSAALSNANEPVLNEDFLIWKKTDQLIVSWLFSTLSESVFGQITQCTTAFEIWSTLENLYSQQSKATVLQIKTEMHCLKKGALSINDYVLKMKGFSEALGAAGQSMSNDDLISSILGGLGPEYDSVVVAITTKQGYISLQEVQFLLMSYESRLAQHNTSVLNDLTHASANYSGTNIYNNRGGFRGFNP